MDMTNRVNKGAVKLKKVGQDFTNRNNTGSVTGAGSTGKDMTSAMYGTKAPRSMGIKTVMKNKPLTGVFKGYASGKTTPAPIPGFGKSRGR
jgi:hypothetical protein